MMSTGIYESMNPVAWFLQAVGVAAIMIHVYPTKPTLCLSLEATSAFKRLRLAWIGPMALFWTCRAAS